MCIVASVTVFTSTSVLAQVNSWINPASGNWDDTSSWSLGVLPNSSQSILITNSDWKAVAVNPSTPVNAPGSMTVDSLTIIGATNTENTLLLNYFGTAVPLTVLNGLTLQDYAQILNFNSGLVVQGGTLTVTNSQINQDGGFIVATNVSLDNSVYNLTNGDFEAGSVSIGSPVSGQFNQYGGTATITNVGLDNSQSAGPIQDGISLYGGTLNLPGGMFFIGGPGGLSYFQAGGTNLTTSITMYAGYAGSTPTFMLNGGLLADSDVTVMGGDFGGPQIFAQNGGSHVITNGMSMDGGDHLGEYEVAAIYNMNNGTLSVGNTIELDADQGDSRLVQTNGTVNAQTIYAHSVGYYAENNTTVTLAGGTLSCLNYTTDDGGGQLNQTGGSLVVSNLLSMGGSREPGGPTYPAIYGTYTFTGGALFASNINITGIFTIGDGLNNQITNPGFFSLSHLLNIGNDVEQLGQFILAGANATIDLTGSTTHLSFANSSDQTWSNGAVMNIDNWNGSLSGGGADQIFFGSDSTGLTAQQLSQMEFINPAGLPSGTYPAQILSDGEVVPKLGSSNSGLVNSWINPASGNWQDAASWSLGIPPASSQSVLITNSGFKAVAIQSSTVTGYPQSLSVNSVTITSPTNSANTLLMNYAAAGNPLVIGVDSNNPGSLIIGDTNSSIVMFSSGLIVNDALGTSNQHVGEFEVEGIFNQSDNSEVVAGFLDLTNNGTYNLTNGELFAGTQFINGTFNQQGGTNTGSVEMDSTNGNYQFFDGVFQGDITMNSGTFQQWGGTVSARLALGRNVQGEAGVYELAGGVLLPGDLDLGAAPITNELENPSGAIEQSGGTNSANAVSIALGTYTLSNGTFTASSLTLTTNLFVGGLYPGEFYQEGGYATNGSVTMIGGTNIDFNNTGLTRVAAIYNLFGGTMDTPSLAMKVGDFGLRDATNHVGTLSMNASFYDMESGLLAVDRIQLTEYSEFWHTAGTLVGPTNLTLGNASWGEWRTSAQLGQLQLLSGTNSGLYLAPSPSVLQFTDSSSVPWAADGRLTILGWSGSLNGGGSQQVFFGTSASGLTAQQLSQVQFSNPAGLPGGTYSARILSDGEVVPNQLITTSSIAYSQQGNNLVLTWPAGWTLQSATNVGGPYSDVTGATSPDTINTKAQPQQFFRLRQ